MISPVLRVRDVDLSLAFYTRVLGFSGEGGLPGLDGKTVFAEAYLGEARVMFSRRSGGICFSNSIELYVTLPDSLDLDGYSAMLKAREVTVAEDIREELWGDRAFTITDLDGNRLIFAQAVRRPVTIGEPIFEQIA